MNMDTHNEWINGQKPHLIKNGIRIQCNTETFVPIVVPGLSTTLQARLPQHPRLLQVRKLIIQITIQQSRASASVDRQARGDPFTSETSEELLHEPTEIPETK